MQTVWIQVSVVHPPQTATSKAVRVVVAAPTCLALPRPLTPCVGSIDRDGTLLLLRPGEDAPLPLSSLRGGADEPAAAPKRWRDAVAALQEGERAPKTK